MDGRVYEPEAWVAATVQALNDVGSWTGRMHIHKTLFLGQVLELADPPFEFELYQYGPYSFELDETIAVLDAFGYLTKSFPEPGYGPKYEVTQLGRTGIEPLADEKLRAIERVGKEVGGWKSPELELVATCLWVQHQEGLTNTEDIVERVRRLKPKYSSDAVQRGLIGARDLAGRLAA